MTLADAIARVRYLLDEPTAKMWSDAEITAWLDEGQKAMCEKRGIEEIWTEELTAATTVTLPTDFMSIYKVDVEDETPDFLTFDNALRFTEAQTGTLTVYGTRAPDTLTSSQDFQLPNSFVDGAIYYACWAANQKDENYAEGGYYQGLFRDKRTAWENSRKYTPVRFAAKWL